MLPQFIIAGAAKCGTTTLVDMLREHHRIFLPQEYPSGEIHFFDYDENYNRGLSYYQSFFKNAKPNQIRGEKTPAYSWLFVPKRMHKHLPEVKLIWMIRNPIKRAYSHWRMYTWRGVEKYSFEKALSFEERRTQKHPMYGYVQQGKYINVLNEYLKYYDKSQMLILCFEDFIASPENNLKKITDFIGVDSLENISLSHKLKAKDPKSIFIQYYLRWFCFNVFRPGRYRKQLFEFMQQFNVSKHPPIMSKVTKSKLEKIFLPFNQMLEDFIGETIEYWK